LSRISKTLALVLLLGAYTFVSGCAIARLALPRTTAAAAQRTAAVALSQVGRSAALRFGNINYAATATAGRATSLAHFRPAPNAAQALHIVSKTGRSLARAKKTGNKIEVKLIDGGQERLLMYSVRERNTIYHYNSFHRRIGYSRLSATRKRIDHFTNDNKSLGHDKLAAQSATHYDWKGRQLSRSRIVPGASNAFRLFRAASRFEDILQAYSHNVVYTNDKVSILFEDYLNAQERCFQPIAPDRKQCQLLPVLYSRLKQELGNG